MGTELRGHLLDGRKRVAVLADFASDHVRLRGGMTGEVSYAEVEPAVDGDRLRLTIHGHVLEFDAGNQAERLAAKVRDPPSRAKKLGVKAGDVVHLVDVPDPQLAPELAHTGATVRAHEPDGRCDGLVVGVEDRAGVAQALRLSAHARWVWVVYPKGVQVVTEGDVRETFRAAGWKDVKTLRFSPSHTGLRFVPPSSP